MREQHDVDVLWSHPHLLERPPRAVTAGDEAVPQVLFDRVVGVDAGVHQDVGAVIGLHQRHRMHVLLGLARLGVSHHAVEELGAPRADAVFDVRDLVTHGFPFHTARRADDAPASSAAASPSAHRRRAARGHADAPAARFPC